MALESIIFGDESMGIFGLGKKKNRKSKTGIATAAAFATAIGAGAANVNAQDDKFKDPVQMNQKIEEQLESGEVPQFLHRTFFQRIPNSKDIIRILNIEGNGLNREDLTAGEVSYILNPKDNTLDRERGTFYNYEHLRLTKEHIQLPEYWVLLKLAYQQTELDWFKSDYKDLKNDIKNEGVKRLATGLVDNFKGNNLTVKQSFKQEKEREKLLLKALYIGANGNDNGVDVILNGNYLNLPDNSVKDKVREWDEKYDYSPFEKYEDNALLAYLSNTLGGKVKEPFLVATTLYVLRDYYNNQGEDTKNRIFNIRENSLMHNGNIPNFYVESENSYHGPFNIF